MPAARSILGIMLCRLFRGPELDAMVTVSGHGFHPPKAQLQVNTLGPNHPASGAHSRSGSKRDPLVLRALQQDSASTRLAASIA